MLKRWIAGALLCVGMVAPHAQPMQPPEVAARNYLLIDLNATQVLAEREADKQSDPASLTKLMTAYLVFNALKDKKITLEQTLPVSVRAWSERKGGGSLMFIDPKMTPKVDELLRGMIAVSGNDAAVALAEGVGGDLGTFVSMMNRQAQAWGLKNTQFKNVQGLTEAGHYSSARDIATIAAHVIREHPNFYATYYSIRQYTFNNIRQDNRNLLLGRDPSVDGMKTGFTRGRRATAWCRVRSATFPMANAACWPWCLAQRRARRAPARARSCSTGASRRGMRCACSKTASPPRGCRCGRAHSARRRSAPPALCMSRCRAARATS